MSSTSSLSAFWSAFFEIFASVVIKESIVHIFGWIIPDPFAMPPMVTVFPPISKDTAASFFLVSVVMIALAAAVPLARSGFFAAASTAMPARTLSMGSCMPMTPVEPTSTLSLSIPSISAASSAVSRQYLMPSSPVHALAIPELTTTAWGFFLLSTTARSHFTGAAFTTFVVNVPAALHGFSL